MSNTRIGAACVKAVLVVGVVHHISHNKTRVTKPNFILCGHPLSPSYVTENDCQGMSPKGVESIVSYISAALANNGGSSCFKSVAAQRSRRMFIFLADICSRQ